jgi:hypothetical protein
MLIKSSTFEPPFTLDESGNDPVLILATKPGEALFGAQRWEFLPGREWFWVSHQAAGVGCHQPEFICTILRWRPTALDAFRQLAAEYEGSNLGIYETPKLTDLVGYSQRLSAIDGALQCETTFRELEEAVYPIDFSQEALAVLSEDVIADFNALVRWASVTDKLVGSIGRWRLCVLAENSD